jgi:N-carbamoyl-L-amino-acid hydrolase
VAVICFADEEGARFNTPTFGSRALAGRLADVLDRQDDHGTTLREALAHAGIEPARLSEAPAWLDRLRGFVEIHIDQSTELARAGAPVAVVDALVDRLRLEAELSGRADHAGTTPREERRDAMAAAARLIVAAEELGEPFERMIVTTARILAEPNAPTTIAARVRLWIDARSPRAHDLDAWHERVRDRAHQLAARTRVGIELAVASRSPGRPFDPPLIGHLKRAGENRMGHTSPEVLCFAGHDAGILAERVPAAMILVRNATGVSHAPEESVDLDDAALAAQVLADALERT